MYLHLAKCLKVGSACFVLEDWLFVYKALPAPRNVVHCTAAITADIQEKDRGGILAKGVKDTIKWKRLFFLYSPLRPSCVV